MLEIIVGAGIAAMIGWNGFLTKYLMNMRGDVSEMKGYLRAIATGRV